VNVIVIGGGIYGQVIAWSLARAKTNVTVLEPIGAGHGRSGSGDRSRIVRGMYGHARFAEAGFRSLAMWRDYQRQLGVALMDPCGVLYLEREVTSPEDDAFARDLRDGMQHLVKLGGQVEQIDPGEVSRRYPGIAHQGLRRAVLEHGAGIGRAARATRAIAAASIATGFVTMRALRATAIHSDNPLRVEGYDDFAREVHTLTADAVVVAAGFEGVDLVAPMLDKPLPIRRIPQYVTYWDMPSPEAEALSRGLPAWAELGAGLYGMPDDGEAGFKIAWHEPRLGDDIARGEPTESDLERLRERGQTRFPGLARARLRATYACGYDATPDENFVIGPLPNEPRVMFVGGMSGHGYKHAPILGEAVASTLLGTAPAIDLGPYALTQFGAA
jgi:sarcosine oxidase